MATCKHARFAAIAVALALATAGCSARRSAHPSAANVPPAQTSPADTLRRLMQRATAPAITNVVVTAQAVEFACRAGGVERATGIRNRTAVLFHCRRGGYERLRFADIAAIHIVIPETYIEIYDPRGRKLFALVPRSRVELDALVEHLAWFRHQHAKQSGRASAPLQVRTKRRLQQDRASDFY